MKATRANLEKRLRELKDDNSIYVYKGHGVDDYGWYYQAFGRNARSVGKTLVEAHETVSNMEIEMKQISADMDRHTRITADMIEIVCIPLTMEYANRTED